MHVIEPLGRNNLALGLVGSSMTARFLWLEERKLGRPDLVCLELGITPRRGAHWTLLIPNWNGKRIS